MIKESAAGAARGILAELEARGSAADGEGRVAMAAEAPTAGGAARQRTRYGMRR